MPSQRTRAVALAQRLDRPSRRPPTATPEHGLTPARQGPNQEQRKAGQTVLPASPLTPDPRQRDRADRTDQQQLDRWIRAQTADASVDRGLARSFRRGRSAGFRPRDDRQRGRLGRSRSVDLRPLPEGAGFGGSADQSSASRSSRTRMDLNPSPAVLRRSSWRRQGRAARPGTSPRKAPRHRVLVAGPARRDALAAPADTDGRAAGGPGAHPPPQAPRPYRSPAGSWACRSPGTAAPSRQGSS